MTSAVSSRADVRRFDPWKAATLAADRLAPRLMLMTEAPFATA